MAQKPTYFALLCTAIFAIVTAFKCVAFEFRSGDILFQVSGNSALSNAISASTAGVDSLDFAHAAIVWAPHGDEVAVIEASPKEGVRIVPLSDFLATSPNINDKPGVVVKRLDIDFPSDTIIANALRHIGEPYDWYYLPDNGKMYCTELIYESFVINREWHIFSRNPMNFRASDGSMPQFWTDLYNDLGVGVPEGIPGTNPNDMSKDVHLMEVYRFF